MECKHEKCNKPDWGNLLVTYFSYTSWCCLLSTLMYCNNNYISPHYFKIAILLVFIYLHVYLHSLYLWVIIPLRHRLLGIECNLVSYTSRAASLLWTLTQLYSWVYPVFVLIKKKLIQNENYSLPLCHSPE